ncbi:hypothetical protein L9F63_013456, partial [Diploptera punctata]
GSVVRDILPGTYIYLRDQASHEVCGTWIHLLDETGRLVRVLESAYSTKRVTYTPGTWIHLLDKIDIQVLGSIYSTNCYFIPLQHFGNPIFMHLDPFPRRIAQLKIQALGAIYSTKYYPRGTWNHLLDEVSRVVRGVSILPATTLGDPILISLGNRGRPDISPGTWIHLLEEASSVVRGVAVLHRHNTRDPRYLILSGIGLLRLYPPALGYRSRHLDPFTRRSESRGPRCCYSTPPQHTGIPIFNPIGVWVRPVIPSGTWILFLDEVNITPGYLDPFTRRSHWVHLLDELYPQAFRSIYLTKRGTWSAVLLFYPATTLRIPIFNPLGNWPIRTLGDPDIYVPLGIGESHLDTFTRRTLRYLRPFTRRSESRDLRLYPPTLGSIYWTKYLRRFTRRSESHVPSLYNQFIHYLMKSTISLHPSRYFIQT